MLVPESTHIFIMAGGSGERFWPLSRKSKPKQLLSLFSNNTLLGETVERVAPLVPANRLYILTNQAQVAPTRAALPDFPAAQIIGEPAKRDTAPAAALATALAYREDKNAIVALLPADQLIKDVPAFQKNLVDTITRASTSSSLFTLAIEPTFPSTGFGYLDLGEARETGREGTDFFRVDRFVEKPDLETAQGFLEAGTFAWNAGMFVWSAQAFIESANRHQPELSNFIRAFPKNNQNTFIAESFVSLPKISVDYAIMQQAEAVEAAWARFDWDDVGSWTALPPHLGEDNEHNSSRGTTTVRDAHHNILFSTGRHIAVCGVDDLVVVETADSVLVCHRDKVQEIKKLLPELPDNLL